MSDRKKKIFDMLMENSHPKESKSKPSISITGGTNVIGEAHSGATINQINTHKHVTRVIAEVKPGDKHITEQQAARLTALVKDICDLEQKLKKNPKSFQSVWYALNSHVGVTRYRLIPLDHFEKAEKYLLMWRGRLDSMKTAPKKDGVEWRKRKLAYININKKSDPDAYDAYMIRTFNGRGLSTLSNDELERVYSYIVGRVRAKKKAVK